MRVSNEYFHTHSETYPIPGALILANKQLIDPSLLSLDYKDSFFSTADTYNYTINLPHPGSLGINIEDDKIFGIPLVTKIHSDSPFWKQCPKYVWTQV